MALARTPDLQLYGKHAGLMVLGDSPFVAETPAHLLDDDVTPVEYLFVRNNGLPPAQDTIDPAKWTLLIDGESVKNPTQLTLDGLKSKFKAVTQHLALECAGNGRSEFFPPAKGNPWTTGGVGFPEWAGVRLLKAGAPSRSCDRLTSRGASWLRLIRLARPSCGPSERWEEGLASQLPLSDEYRRPEMVWRRLRRAERCRGCEVRRSSSYTALRHSGE